MFQQSHPFLLSQPPVSLVTASMRAAHPSRCLNYGITYSACGVVDLLVRWMDNYIPSRCMHNIQSVSARILVELGELGETEG